MKTVGAAMCFATILCVVDIQEPAEACGKARRGDFRARPIETASETAIIVWDEASQMEHFIRRAVFNTEVPDFGFLVPTPTQPTLEEVTDESFAVLKKLTEPKVVKEKAPAHGMSCGCGSKGGRDASKGAVEVLEEKSVAGYDAAVLKSSDVNALGQWLKDRDYEFSADLADWVAPYVKEGWIITAFKIARDAKKKDEKSLNSSAVRMSFKTPRPFFPYREAKEPTSGEASPRRLLRVYLLAAKRMQGKQGDTLWPRAAGGGGVRWANTVPTAEREKVMTLLKLPANTLSAACWLTELEDRTSPRIGTEDVYFSESPTQEPVERPPHIQYVSNTLPTCLACYALAAYMFIPCLMRHCRARRRDDTQS